jgi:YD repeat-containing protein
MADATVLSFATPQTGRTTLTEYNAQGQTALTADLAGNHTFYEYHPSGAGAGQLKKITHADGAYVNYDYDLHGRVTAQTGSADYPVRYTYHTTDGWMTAMKTYRDRDGDGSPVTSSTSFCSTANALLLPRPPAPR